MNITAKTDELWRELAELCENSVPADYISLLENYPAKLRHALRSGRENGDEGSVADVELLSSLPDVVEINREARLSGITDPDGNEFFWPEQLLVIGETGTGDYYCIDVSGDNEGVIQYLHQSIEFEVIADSLDEFVGMLLETFEADILEN